MPIRANKPDEPSPPIQSPDLIETDGAKQNTGHAEVRQAFGLIKKRTPAELDEVIRFNEIKDRIKLLCLRA